MMTFKERLGKPSNAVQAMLDGLRSLDDREDVTINMAVFVRKLPGLPCLVCAATAAAMQATDTPVEALAEVMEMDGVDEFEWDSLVRAIGSVDRDDLVRFEVAMNAFRMGEASDLLDYFDVPYEHPAYKLRGLWFLDTFHWRERLDPVEEYRDKLIELGL